MAKAIQKFGDFDSYRLGWSCRTSGSLGYMDMLTILCMLRNASQYILSDPVDCKANTLGTMNVLEFARRKAVRNYYSPAR